MLTTVAALLALSRGQTPQQVLHPGADPADSQTWHLRITRVVPTSFLLTFPEDYNKDKKTHWPLLVFLHGSGERGADITKIRRHGLPKEIAAGRKFPFIVVSPQCPEGQLWDAAVLTQLIDMVERRCRVDKRREYVTGLSMGGYGTYELAAANPNRFAAIAPISGGGSWMESFSISHTPAYIVHGDADPIVPVEEDRRMVQYLRDDGDEVKYTEIKGGGHDVWSDVYAGTELYDWLLSHSRRGR